MTYNEEDNLRREAEKLNNLDEDQRIRRADFVKLPMWFDKDEDSKTLNSKKFY